MRNDKNKTTSAIRYGSLCSVCALLLSGCGGSDSDIASETISATLAEDTSWQTELSFSDTAIMINQPQHGQLTLSNDSATYTPEADYNGSDSATVEAGNTRYRFSFDITPVNDAPRFVSRTIALSADNEMVGQIEAYDPDGDDISFSLVSQPQQGRASLGQDGSFTYYLDGLSLPDDAFVVSISDGKAESEASIELKPAYNTNEQKSAYYYRSDKSHLKLAEQLNNSINDDVISQDSYIALAQGYVKADLPEKSDEILAQKIFSQQALAQAHLKVALAYEQSNQPESASKHRLSSLQYQTDYIVDNGVTNINRDDAGVLLTLFNDMNDANDSEGADKVIAQLESFTQAIGGKNEEYQSAFGKMVTAARSQTSKTVETYQRTNSTKDLELALASTDRLASIVKESGYQFVKTGEHKGERFYQLGPIYVAQAAEFYYSLGATEKVKDLLAYVFSYYTDTNYDPEHYYPVKNYAQRSLEQNQYPLQLTAGLMELIYPDKDNVAVQLVTPDMDFYYDRVLGAVEKAKALSTILQGGSANDAIAIIEQQYGDNLRDLQEQYSGQTAYKPFFGGQLIQLGYISEAKQVLSRGIDILQNPTYLSEQGNTKYTTGTRGCLKYWSFVNKVDDSNLMNELVQACQSILDTQYSPTNATDKTAFRFLNAYLDLATLYQLIGEPEQSIALLNEATVLFDVIEKESEIQAKQRDYFFARMSLKDFDSAYRLLQQMTNAWLSKEPPEDTEEELGNLLALHKTLVKDNYNAGSVVDHDSALPQLRKTAYNDTNYSENYERFSDIERQLSTEIIKRFNNQPAPVQIDLAEDVVENLSYARRYKDAHSMLENSYLSASDQLEWLALIAKIQATQDDFPNSSIATVDTDHDGLANFISVNASDAEIEQSDIQLDNDADGDGVPDEIDPMPLG